MLWVVKPASQRRVVFGRRILIFKEMYFFSQGPMHYGQFVMCLDIALYFFRDRHCRREYNFICYALHKYVVLCYDLHGKTFNHSNSLTFQGQTEHSVIKKDRRNLRQCAHLILHSVTFMRTGGIFDRYNQSLKRKMQSPKHNLYTLMLILEWLFLQIM